MTETTFPCCNCGAEVEFLPGSTSLHCPYCGANTPIDLADSSIEELDYAQHLRESLGREETVDVLTVKCESCGAESTTAPNVTSDSCPFCGANIVAMGKSTKQHKPKSVLPFRVEKGEARTAYQKWIGGLWFAPNALKRLARQDSPLAGLYVPYWTYDCHATTPYSGMRGDDYWDTQTYTTTENGRSVTRTRQVRKTRWRPASGTVRNQFDDVLVMASHSLPEKYARELEPWDLQCLVPYQDEYLGGFRAESYQIGLEDGFELAKGVMKPVIEMSIRHDIGGDHQRIISMNPRYEGITFKHLLLPIWLSTYRYRDTVYRFLVNARTGEVQGERPWSWTKIALATLAGLLVAGAIGYGIYIYQG